MDSLCAGFEMCRVNATTVLAGVMKDVSLGHWPHQHFIRSAVGKNRNHAVATVLARSCPVPAPVRNLLHSIPEVLPRRAVFGTITARVGFHPNPPYGNYSSMITVESQ